MWRLTLQVAQTWGSIGRDARIVLRREMRHDGDGQYLLHLNNSSEGIQGG